MGAANSRDRRSSSGPLITCPECSERFGNELSLVQHYNLTHPNIPHNESASNNSNPHKFNVGDRVLAMWESAKWQYFPATIAREIDDGLKYEIDWDDGDTTGRVVDSCNIYQNTPVNPQDVQTGTKVLFKQGSYGTGGCQLTGGDRWHEGIITEAHRLPGGIYRFNGHHTKGANDGKSLGYHGYNHNFKNYTIDSLRLSTSNSNVTGNDLLTNRSSALQNNSSNTSSGGAFEVGDRVLAMWGLNKWQYFPATIAREIEDGLKYEIDWDDGDTTGRVVDVCNIYRDIKPNSSNIEIGSKVLFSQGSYRAGDTQTSGGKRWHEGVVTSINSVGGRLQLSGHHTKGVADGKSTSYGGYVYNFTNYAVDSLRLSGSSTQAIATNNQTGSQSTINNANINRTFNTGDGVLAMWSLEMWQYFRATIVRKIPGKNQYEINWDDGDTTGRIVDSFNIYLNANQPGEVITEGSKVLFQQGAYSAGSTQQSGGNRWHEGVITNVHTLPGGVYRYTGHHTKSANDGKWIDYVGYQYKFERVSGSELRLFDNTSSSNVLNHSMVSLQPSIAPRKHVDLDTKFYLEVGDRVLAEYKRNGKFYSATICEVLSNSKYMVNWFDGDVNGREVRHIELNLDSIPKPEELSKDSIIFFQDEELWHPGLITNIYNGIDGTSLYDVETLHGAKSYERLPIDKLSSKIEVTDTGFLMTPTTSLPPVNPQMANNRLNVGDRVLAMWIKTKWQYFPATIRKVLPNLQYKIEWDDQDSTGLIVDCFNLAKDVIPEAQWIGVGSIVLFQQGGYSGNSDLGTIGGTRWHQGVITEVRQDEYRRTLYDGKHTKSAQDGKWVTYRGYSPNFYGVEREDLRVGPNMFEVLNSQSIQPVIESTQPSAPPYSTEAPPSYDEVVDGSSGGIFSSPPLSDPVPPYSPPSMSGSSNVSQLLKDIDPFVGLIERCVNRTENNAINADIFISYIWNDSFAAKELEQVTNFKGTAWSDPRCLARDLASDKHKIWLDIDSLTNSTQTIFEQHAKAIRNCKIFIPFISDDYSASMFCRMQFQFACGFQDKRIIPIIVGEGSDWKSSVIGISLENNGERFKPIINMQNVHDEETYHKILYEILSAVGS